jgi:hypothetical protein
MARYNTNTVATRGGEPPDEVTDAPPAGIKHPTGMIYNATQEGGKTTRLFKVLQTNACRYACKYCFTSCAIRRKRTTFKPDELATTFVTLNQQKRVDGLFLSAENPEQVELLAKLGKHKMGKACLYFKRLADLDTTVLEALIAGSVAEVKRRYPDTGGA